MSPKPTSGLEEEENMLVFMAFRMPLSVLHLEMINTQTFQVKDLDG